MTETDATYVKQQKLDQSLLQDQSLPFISDWNGTHPYAPAYLGDAASFAPTQEEYGRYWWLVDDLPFIERIRDIHERNEGRRPPREQIIPGPGSSTFISAYVLWLVSNGVREAYFIPPIYFTFHYFAKTFGLRLRQISGRHVFEPQFTMNLPATRTHLIISDPVWYAGKTVTQEVMERLRRWQADTGSEIFVDGSFQFLRWSGERHELSSELAPELTWRLLCPGKALGMPGYRFAYAIAPPAQYKDFRWFYETALGSNSIGDVKFARRSVDVLASPDSNRDFATFLGQTYRALESDGLIETSIAPDCSYFVFARLTREPRRPFRKMDQSYFEQSRYPGYIRINLMQADTLRELLMD